MSRKNKKKSFFFIKFEKRTELYVYKNKKKSFQYFQKRKKAQIKMYLFKVIQKCYNNTKYI